MFGRALRALTGFRSLRHFWVLKGVRNCGVSGLGFEGVGLEAEGCTILHQVTDSIRGFFSVTLLAVRGVGRVYGCLEP